MLEGIEGTVDVDLEKLGEEADKITGEEETPSGSAPDETSKGKTKETSEEEAQAEGTALKTQEKSEEEGKEDVQEFEGVPKGFANHPAWKKIISERDEARQLSEQVEPLQNRVQELEQSVKTLEGFDPTELSSLKEAGKILRANPELNKQVLDLINNYNFGDPRVRGELTATQTRLEQLETNLVLEKFDTTVDKLMADSKVEDNIKPLVREILENRVINQKVGLKDISKVYDKVLKDVETFRRKTLSDHIKTREGEKKVPASSKERDKVLVAKKEPEDDLGVRDELASGLKALRSSEITEE